MLGWLPSENANQQNKPDGTETQKRKRREAKTHSDKQKTAANKPKPLLWHLLLFQGRSHPPANCPNWARRRPFASSCPIWTWWYPLWPPFSLLSLQSLWFACSVARAITTKVRRLMPIFSPPTLSFSLSFHIFCLSISTLVGFRFVLVLSQFRTSRPRLSFFGYSRKPIPKQYPTNENLYVCVWTTTWNRETDKMLCDENHFIRNAAIGGGFRKC